MSNKLAVTFDEKKIDEIFAGIDQCHLPGAAVGIAIDGVPVYRKGFGLASIELPFILSPSIRMRIGSTTKHFACLAYMLLCEEGKADIDDPVVKYLPELHPVTHKVTMRQLMGHLGGLRDAYEVSMQFSGTGRPATSPELLAIYEDIDDVSAAPGTAWSYNNGGYLMLSTAIERITGEPLEDVLKTRIFAPVGMHDTMLRRWDTDFVPNSATLHMATIDGGYEKSYMGMSIAGEGGMVSTVDDMLRWLKHMDAPIVGSEATWALMKTPQKLASGASTSYGLGLMRRSYRGAELVTHGGGVMGGNSDMLKVPSAGIDIAIMVNRSDVGGSALAMKILDACLPGLDPVQEATGPVATGSFLSPTTGRIIQLFGKDGKQIVSVNGGDLPFVSYSKGVLQPEGTSTPNQIVNLQGDPDKPSAIQYSDFGATDDLVPLPAAENAEITAIAGRYRSETTRTVATVFSADDGPNIRFEGRFGTTLYKLESLGRDIWRVRAKGMHPLGGIITFSEGASSFSFTTMRTQGLTFRREG